MRLTLLVRHSAQTVPTWLHTCAAAAKVTMEHTAPRLAKQRRHQIGGSPEEAQQGGGRGIRGRQGREELKQAPQHQLCKCPAWVGLMAGRRASCGQAMDIDRD